MNNASRQELKATIAEQFKAMREYEAQVEGLWTRVAKLEAGIIRVLKAEGAEEECGVPECEICQSYRELRDLISQGRLYQ